MDKDVAMPAGADLDIFRDQADAVFFQTSDGCGQVGNAEGHMVQAFAALGDEFCNHRIL